MTMLEPMPGPSKGPLQSKSIVLGAIALVGGIVGKSNPDAGAWISDNADTLLALFGGLLMAFRSGSSKTIDWKNFTLGIKKKF